MISLLFESVDGAAENKVGTSSGSQRLKRCTVMVHDLRARQSRKQPPSIQEHGSVRSEEQMSLIDEEEEEETARSPGHMYVLQLHTLLELRHRFHIILRDVVLRFRQQRRMCGDATDIHS